MHNSFKLLNAKYINVFGAEIKTPLTFSGVIMKTLFNGGAAVDKMMDNFDKTEEGKLLGSLNSVGKNELGMNSFLGFVNWGAAVEKLQENADKATVQSLDMDIGF